MWSPFRKKGKQTPDVIVDFIFDNGLIFISLKNIGEAPAYIVSVTFDHELSGLGGNKSVSNMPLFRRVEFMPPQKTITTFLDTSASYFGREQPLEVEAHVVFHDRRGTRHVNKIRHNLEIYRDIAYVQGDGRHPDMGARHPHGT